LIARQRFVQQTAELDPADLKTLAPVQPARRPVDPIRRRWRARRVAEERRCHWRVDAGWRGASVRGKAEGHGRFPAGDQANRVAQGEARAQVAHRAERAGEHQTPGGHRARKEFTAFDVKVPPGGRAAASGHGGGYALLRRHRARARTRVRSVNLGVAAVAKEVGGRIVGYRIYMQR